MTNKLSCTFNNFRQHLVELTTDRSVYEKYIECADTERRQKLFTRNRVWTFQTTALAVLCCFKDTLSAEIEQFLCKENLPQTTPEAYIKRRGLVSASFFSDLNAWLLHDAFHNGLIRTWHNGKYLCGIDGSRVSLPYTPDLYEKYRQRDDKGHNLARGVFVTDLINRTVVAADLMPNKTEERKAALTVMGNVDFPYPLRHTVFVMDRGYPSMQLMNWFKDNTGGFIIRARRDTNPAIKDFMASEDTTRDVTLCLSPNRRGLDYPEPEPITVRLIKRPPVKGQSEPVVLMTNLSKKDFPDPYILEAYRLRWNSETEIGTLKNECQIEIFSGVRDICIRQDFFASIILYNLETLIRIPCNKRLSEHMGKHPLQVDMNGTWKLIISLVSHLFKSKYLFDEELTSTVKLFLRMVSVIRPGRHGPRSKRTIKLNGKYITLTNYKRGL